VSGRGRQSAVTLTSSLTSFVRSELVEIPASIEMLYRDSGPTTPAADSGLGDAHQLGGTPRAHQLTLGDCIEQRRNPVLTQLPGSSIKNLGSIRC